MKRSEVDWNEEAKELLNKLLYKNVAKFARKFNLGICCVAPVENQYKLLKEDFERVFPNLNFEDEWKKVTYEYDEIIALGV